MNDVIYNLISYDGVTTQYVFKHLDDTAVLHTYGPGWSDRFIDKSILSLKDTGNVLVVEMPYNKVKKLVLDYSEVAELYITLEHHFKVLSDERNKFKIQKFVELVE